MQNSYGNYLSDLAEYLLGIEFTGCKPVNSETIFPTPLQGQPLVFEISEEALDKQQQVPP